MGNMAAVYQEVTGDASTQTWDTGLSRVLFYIGATPADADCLPSGWYYNYSDNGSTAKAGAVYHATAPDDGEVWYCFGFGRP
jgi:hypothetical protein